MRTFSLAILGLTLRTGAEITVASLRMLPASEPTLAASATTVIAAPILTTHLLTDAAVRSVQAADPQPTVASQPVAQPKKAKPPLLTWQEKRFLFPIEKRLVTPFKSKANPGDRDTHFVLMFRDVAGVQTHSRTRSSSSITESLTTEVAKWDGAIIIHGRKEAALTVARFLTKDNAAARSLEVPVQHAEQKSQLASNKVWDYRAFATEELAQLYLISILPPVAKTTSSPK